MWFTSEEFCSRRARAQSTMSKFGLDYVLVLEPENVTYLTGFFTEGYHTSFQAAILPADGPPITIFREAERFHFEATAAWPDRTVSWLDGESRTSVIARALREAGVRGRVGFEGSSWMASYSTMKEVMAERSDLGWVALDQELTRLRLIKSPAEIEFHRRAGVAVDAMQLAVTTLARAGLAESDLVLAASAAGLRAGNHAVDPGPLAAGERSRHIHSFFSIDGVIGTNDLIFSEMDASHRCYRTRSMRTIALGSEAKAVAATYAQFVELQDQALDTVRPGAACAETDAILRKGVVSTRWVKSYPNKTFYGLGFLLIPNTAEPFEVTEGSSLMFEEGMVLHSYLSAAGINISDTIVVTKDGHERLTNAPRELIKN